MDFINWFFNNLLNILFVAGAIWGIAWLIWGEGRKYLNRLLTLGKSSKSDSNRKNDKLDDKIDFSAFERYK